MSPLANQELLEELGLSEYQAPVLTGSQRCHSRGTGGVLRILSGFGVPNYYLETSSNKQVT